MKRVIIIGGNGSGKTTFARHVDGIILFVWLLLSVVVYLLLC